MINNTLKARILEKFDPNQGGIPFSVFMAEALYAPNLGFYTSETSPIGREGHFTTAPEISPLFGDSIAHHISPYLSSKTVNSVLEFGGGTGRLALSLLLSLEKYHALPERYYLLDLSPTLKYQQQHLIKTQAPHLFERCIWLDKLPNTPIDAICLANEVLDAMPVNRFAIQKGEVFEVYVTEDNETFKDFLYPPSDRLLTRVKQLMPLNDGYQSEVNLYVRPWLQSLYDVLDKGLVYLIDYGFCDSEYYHPDRAEGTLMCHHRHKAHPNPYIHLGKQDITAHVDFTYVAESADEIGFEVKGYTHQASFLLANGITDKIDESTDETLFRDTQAVKMLTLPNEMGELFKVMALGKGMDDPLDNFALIDLRRQL